MRKYNVSNTVIDINDQHIDERIINYDGWKSWDSGICLDFDYISSSITKSKDIHSSLSECTICDKIGDEYYVSNNNNNNIMIKTIDDIEELEKTEASFLITCSNEFDSSFTMEKPIGIQPFHTIDTNEVAPFLNDSFKYFCFTHSPGLQMDNAMMNEKYLFRMKYIRNFYGSFEDLHGKKIKNIYPSQSAVITPSVRNMIFIASYFMGNEHNHFMPGVVPKMAMIYDLIINQYKYENIHNKNKLNITIISHLDIRNDDEKQKENTIQHWFWTRFVKHFQDNYKEKIVINLLDIIDHSGWLLQTNYTHWSDMFITPHLILNDKKFIDYILYPRGILQPLHWMLNPKNASNIKQFIILYYDRGSDHFIQRSIKNNEQVKDTINYWIDNILNVIQDDILFKFEIFNPQKFLETDIMRIYQSILHIGCHGGGLANLIFAKSETFVLEFNDWNLKHETKLRTWYYALSQAKNLHYFYLSPNNFLYEIYTKSKLQIQANIDIAKLNKMLFIIQQRMIKEKIFKVSNNKSYKSYDNINITDIYEPRFILSSDILDHLKSLERIPKLIHIIWPDKTIINSSFNMIEHGVKKLDVLNPEWKLIVHDYDDIESGLKNTDLITDEDYILIKDAHIVEKSDIFILILLYEVGGLYIDIDRAVNIPLNEVIHNDTKMVIPTSYDVNFCQDLFASPPHNQLILNAFHLQWKIRKKGYNGKPLPRKNGWIRYDDHITLTNSWSESLELDLFGRRLREKEWDEARYTLQQTNNLIVTKKDMWCDGILVTDYDGCKQIERESLYKAYNITSWSHQVKTVWGET